MIANPQYCGYHTSNTTDAMPRTILTDEYWLKLVIILRQIGIYNKPNLRLTIEGMLYRIRIGCLWRDLPSEFGQWNSVFKKFNSWSEQGKWLKIFEAIVQEPDMEWLFIDGSYVRAHQHSAGAATSGDEAIAKTLGGNPTKIHLSVDACGYPVAFEITGGNVNDSTTAPQLLAQTTEAETVIADKGYDSDAIPEPLSSRVASLLFHARGIPAKAMPTLIGICTSFVTWLKIHLHD